jgi:hypothetical protein
MRWREVNEPNPPVSTSAAHHGAGSAVRHAVATTPGARGAASWNRHGSAERADGG